MADGIYIRLPLKNRRRRKMGKVIAVCVSEEKGTQKHKVKEAD